MARTSKKGKDAAEVSSKTRQTYTVGAYVRLSVLDRKEKGDSIETQQAIIKAYIDERPDLELAEIYIDNGRSGQSFDRPAFIQMIADMENGKINCCISKDLSRLGRNAIDTGYYIEKYFPTHGIRYIAITDNYDSISDNNSIMVSLKNMFNEAHALESGRKVKVAKQVCMKSGKYVGRMAPYGYLKSKANKHVLIPDENIAPIIKQIFEMAGNGVAVSVIKNWLNDNEILPPRCYFHSIGLVSDKELPDQKHWSIKTVYAILRNRVYCGDIIQGKYTVKDSVLKKKPESDWVIVENTHEALVSRELFEKIQSIRDKNRKGYSTPKVFPKNIFVGKILCGHCGYSLERSRWGKNNYAFACRTNINYSTDDCTSFAITENSLKEMFFSFLNEQAAILNGITSSSQISKERDIQKAELAKLQSEINKNSYFLKSLYESLMNTDITNVEYKELKAGYEAKIASLSEKEAQMRISMMESAINSTKISKAIDHLQTVQQISDLSAEIIDKLVDKILIFRDKHIEVHLKFADEVNAMSVAKDSIKEDTVV